MSKKPLPLLIWLLLWAFIPASLLAQDEKQAGLVIVYEEGLVETACVTFSEATITGSELLSRSHLNVERDVVGLGEQVCRIGETGCPASDCFCQCQGGADCTYWSYWQQVDGAWRYSQAGAGMVQVTEGTIQGWVWGAGSSGEAPEPPPITLDEICAVPEPTVTGIAATLPPATALAVAEATATTAAALATPTAAPTSGTTSPWPYVVFLGLLLGLGMAFFVTRKRSV
jgi:hypothetical protein